MNKNKQTTLLICGILAVIFSLLFVVIRPATPIFIVSYIFAILGLAALCASTWYVISHGKSYPWAATIPSVITKYLILQLLISTVVVLVEQLAKWSTGAVGLIEWAKGFYLAPGWYVLIHVILLLITAIKVILLKGGTEHIERRDAAVKVKTRYIAELKTEIELLTKAASDAGIKDQLKKLAEAVRYSDPMSDDSLASLEYQMIAKAGELKVALADTVKASTLINEITSLLEERNAKCKVLK